MEKTHFCNEVSDHYGIPLLLMEKIADRCPIVIKKDLPFKKAKLLAIAFKSFGASISVEKKKKIFPNFLEFSTDKNCASRARIITPPEIAWRDMADIRKSEKYIE